MDLEALMHSLHRAWFSWPLTTQTQLFWSNKLTSRSLCIDPLKPDSEKANELLSDPHTPDLVQIPCVLSALMHLLNGQQVQTEAQQKAP